MTYEYSKLSGAIREKFETQSKFASAMNMSERTLSLKVNGKIDWKQKEIIKCCELLDIDVKNLHEYFFSQNVQCIEHNNKTA